MISEIVLIQNKVEITEAYLRFRDRQSVEKIWKHLSGKTIEAKSNKERQERVSSPQGGKPFKNLQKQKEKE